MSPDSETVLQDAMTLPATERAAVAAELLASLDEAPHDDPEAVRKAWAEELTARALRAESGEDAGEDWSVVRDRARDSLTR